MFVESRESIYDSLSSVIQQIMQYIFRLFLFLVCLINRKYREGLIIMITFLKSNHHSR